MANSDEQRRRQRTFGEMMFGDTESNAIARAKYKREMGINPAAKRLSNAEASRSAQSMDNPTSKSSRSPQLGTDALRKEAAKTGKIGAKQGPALGVGKMGAKQGPTRPSSGNPVGTTVNFSGPGNYASAVTKKAAPGTDKFSSPGNYSDAVKKKDSTANQGDKKDKPTKQVKQGYSGNWAGSGPARKSKTAQEATRRNELESYNRDKANSRLKPVFGGKKAAPAKKKNPITQTPFAQLLQGQRKK